MGNSVVYNRENERYELEAEGHIAFAQCRCEGGKLYILHVEAPPVLRGTGAAGRLMQGIMESAQAEGMEVVPVCGYAAAWLRRRNG